MTNLIDNSKAVTKHTFHVQYLGKVRSNHPGREPVECWSIVLTYPGKHPTPEDGGVDYTMYHEAEGWTTGWSGNYENIKDEIVYFATLTESLSDGFTGLLAYLELWDSK